MRTAAATAEAAVGGGGRGGGVKRHVSRCLAGAQGSAGGGVPCRAQNRDRAVVNLAGPALLAAAHPRDDGLGPVPCDLVVRTRGVFWKSTALLVGETCEQ